MLRERFGISAREYACEMPEWEIELLQLQAAEFDRQRARQQEAG